MSKAAAASLIVSPKSVISNPDPADLKIMVGEMPNARLTEFGNYNVETEVVARSTGSTYIVTDDPGSHSGQCIAREEGNRIARLQDEYIKNSEMIVIDGFIGGDPSTRTSTRLIVERRNANIAAMQQQLYFTPSLEELAHFDPILQVIYTPNLKVDGYPDDRVIAVDLQNNVTRVLNSDYFGESKKGGLRMWNRLVYEEGGLSLHAGCKMIPVNGTTRVLLVVGLSGTGKTTTTFTRQNNSCPLQDDFVSMHPDGRISSTENGCFAKTFGLDARYEPIIHHAVIQPTSYLENVSMNADGKVDFFDDTYTQNGRATFGFDQVESAGDICNIPRADYLLILNRNDNIIPAVAKLTGAQAAAYFMLGETMGTSAGGAAEEGKALRVPGTNPFFPLLHGHQGTRILELLQKSPMDVFLMNTGWVGGPDGTDGSRKVKILHSSAIVKGIAEGTIQWTRDPDFGYEVATHVPGIETSDECILRPKSYYEEMGQSDKYDAFVTRLKSDRRAHLLGFDGLRQEIVDAVS